ncbi:protein unhypothetical protein [Limosa lapponica baueri]|uniref:Protein UNC80 C-terminal domain-containing protein n=1 Tax=Limosa lapponica baueri TaxID=1758121 RepID=A0A2I0TKU6_LIMLA|nr:protein unhypothetical protein [Limosa lapponica baueri]
MYFVRTPCEWGMDAISATLTFLWEVVGYVEGLFFKDLKQTMKKEQCEVKLLVTASMPGTKTLVVHGQNECDIPTQLPVHEDTQFEALLKECLEFFNIPETQSSHYFLMDKRWNLIHYNKTYVRDIYPFRRSVSPQLNLVQMPPEKGQELIQKQVFTRKLEEVGRVLFLISLTQKIPTAHKQSHVSMLQEDLLRLPSFPRSAIDAEFSLFNDPQDFCYGNEDLTFSISEAIKLCVTVVAYAPESFRSLQMLMVLEALVPCYLQKLKRQTSQVETVTAAREEIAAMAALATSLQALLYSVEVLTRPMTAPQMSRCDQGHKGTTTANHTMSAGVNTRRQVEWEPASNLIEGVCLTLQRQPIISFLPHLRSLINVCVNLVMGVVGPSSVADGLPLLHLSPYLSPPLPFSTAVVRLVALQIQALKEDFPLSHVVSPFTNQERREGMLLNLLIPFVLTVGSGSKDSPWLEQPEVLLLLQTVINILLPPRIISTSRSKNFMLESSPAHCSTPGDAGKDLRREGLAESTSQAAYLALKVILVCFERQLDSQWYWLSLQVKEMALRKVGGLALWDFLDFIVRTRIPIFVLLRPFIQCKLLAQPAENHEELTARQHIADQLERRFIPRPLCKSSLIAEFNNELKILKEAVHSGSDDSLSMPSVVSEQEAYLMGAIGRRRFSSHLSSVSAPQAEVGMLPSQSEPNVLDDSPSLATEGSLSRYSVNTTCLSVCVRWETSRFQTPLSLPLTFCRSFHLCLLWLIDIQACESKGVATHLQFSALIANNFEEAEGKGKEKAVASGIAGWLASLEVFPLFSNCLKGMRKIIHEALAVACYKH